MTALDDSTSLVLELSALHNQLLKRMEQQLSVHGISFAELLVLRELHETPNETLRRIDLAERVGLSASGVTRLLKPMEKLHWVEKETNPRDARVSLVKLSDSGRTLYADAFVSFTQSAGSCLKSLNKQQIASFLALIKAVK
jgi:DNA-binding MarR family transcriptional regulator